MFLGNGIYFLWKKLSHFYVLIIRDAAHKNPDIWNLAAESYYSLPAIVTWNSVTAAPTDMACVPGLLVTSLIPLKLLLPWLLLTGFTLVYQ